MKQIEANWTTIERLQTTPMALAAEVRELARGLVEVKQILDERGAKQRVGRPKKDEEGKNDNAVS
uniref:Uncharacterized protein n=1 Tax=viral metagenome TaxID=1070528 RepID=A0A6M3L7G0_9ZZZZ